MFDTDFSPKSRPRRIVRTNRRTQVETGYQIGSNRLGDKVERLAKPIAQELNELAPKVIKLGHWMQNIGKEGKCGCQSRKRCLNTTAWSWKHPLKSLSEVVQCFTKKQQNH